MINLIGGNKAVRMFNAAINGVSNAKPAMRKISTMQLRQIQEGFKTSGKSVTGSSWKPLRPSTIREKAKKGFTTRILERTGRLKSSFKVFSMTNNNLAISNRTPYFAQHQLGKAGGTFKAKLPQRQMLGHSRFMISDANRIFLTHVFNQIKKAI